MQGCVQALTSRQLEDSRACRSWATTCRQERRRQQQQMALAAAAASAARHHP